MLSDHAAAIGRAYGVGPPLQEMIMVARGEQGRVWRLDTDMGTFAIKELIIRQTPADASADFAYQEAVRATGAVPMPRPVRTTDGRVVVDLAEYQLRGYEWVDVLAPDRSGAAPAPFADALDGEIPELLRLEGLKEPPTNLQSCHRDLWADNILPTPAGGVCVIDWENCGLADMAQELPMAMFDFACDDQRRVAELYHAYIAAGGPARLSGYAAFTMVIAQFGHFWESAIARYLSTDAAEDKAHSLDRIAELLNPPLRVTQLEEMLDTVASVR